MKSKGSILQAAALALTPLLAGCAGYNNTLFMTKSNVGLDFDTKPPTLEVNVSRKEAVIAPSFEGGQTPPVMASFRPGAGTGKGFTSFFMGVDQTFAGGDAAMAMAKLYNEPTATNTAAYDSTLQLSSRPDYTDVFRKVPSSGATRPFIFGTDTSFGFKAAWTGTGGQIPDTVRLGFNRKEFAWAPLSGTNVTGSVVNVKMPSFLATVESSQKIDTNGTSVQALQYFATGNAATHLAMRREVRAAMHERMDPNGQAFKAKFGKSASPILHQVLGAVYQGLNALKNNDPEAKKHWERLDNLKDLGLPDTYENAEIPIYGFDDANAPMVTVQDIKNKALSPKDANHVIQFLARLEHSVAKIKRAQAQITAKAAFKLSRNDNAAVDLNDDEKRKLSEELAKQLKLQEKRLAELQEAISSNPDVVAAYVYLNNLIKPQ